MKKYLFWALIALAGRAKAQLAPLTRPTVTTYSAGAPCGVTQEAELTRFQVRRLRHLGILTRQEVHSIRSRQRRYNKALTAYQRQEAAKLHN